MRPGPPHKRRTFAGPWRRYWREVLAGGHDPRREADMRDAFVSGALSAPARAENWTELATSAGIEPVDPIPPRGLCS